MKICLCSRWILKVLVCIMLASSVKPSAPDGSYILKVPKVYTAFSGDLHINYSTPQSVSLPNAYVRLLATSGSLKHEIATRSLEAGKSAGHVKISCGEIEHAADYIVELHMYVGGPLLNTTSFKVEWPKFQLLLPLRHLAQTKQLPLWYTSDATCKSPVKRHRFYLELEYTKDMKIVQPTEKIPNVVFEIKDTKSFDEINNQTGKVIFPCEFIDAAGRYIAVLRNTYNVSEVIAHSNVVDVRWSSSYRISIYSTSVFPCGGHLTVKYVQPTCPGNNDQIRMYFLRRTLTGSPAVPLDRIYVTERPALTNQSSVLFPCNIFDLTAIGYCFVYVNKAKDGSVTEQDDVCISAHPNTVIPKDGDWSGWSAWSSCSRSCGVGKQSRGRTCTDPEPANGGRFCKGFPVEWKLCDTECPDVIPNTRLTRQELDGTCSCGCTLTNTSGEIIGTGRCKGLSQWKINAAVGHIIKLKFDYFNILVDEQWLRVRDGTNSKDDLLAQSYGRMKVTAVKSSSNKLLLQMMTRYNSSLPPLFHRKLLSLNPSDFLSRKLQSYGFIAVYETEKVENASVVFGTIPMTSHTESSIWESTVTIAGISLCLTIIIILSALAIYHRFCYRKKHKYKMAAHEETPTHIAKSTSMHSTPSHHSALSGVEIDYDMERPLTGKKKNSSGRVSRGSSISSNRSNERRVKVKATVECSPKLIPKQYSPLPSPKIKTMKGDEADKGSLFNTSPLLNKKPRSPKIHPSPRLKKSVKDKIKVKSPTSPDTKYDLLIKRRRSKGDKVEKDIEERIVPGSDNTPVVEEKAFTSVKSPDPQETLTPTNAKPPSVPGEKKCLETVDIPLVTLAKSEETRNPASGASDESSPDNNEKTTSFTSSKRPPRPTSLNEIHKKFPSSTSVSSDKKRRFGDRNKGLPQPDGESPKSSLTQSSKHSTPKSVHSSNSKLTLSPTRSITSDNLEMEYDDFIDYDDPLSYFDPEELEKLKWKGVEKISPKIKEEED